MSRKVLPYTRKSVYIENRQYTGKEEHYEKYILYDIWSSECSSVKWSDFAPGYALFEGYPRVAVTSTFREKRKDDTKPNSFNNDDSKSFK